MHHDLKASLKWTAAGVLIAALYGMIVLNDHRLPWLFAGNQNSDSAVSLRRRIGLAGVLGSSQHPVPTGKGVAFGHVEGNFGDYLPNLNDTSFLGVQMTPQSGDSKVNGHTAFTSRVVYGPAGLAPGVSEVHFYTTAHWMTDGVLKAGSQHAPNPNGLRVFTHSWIGGRNPRSTEILRRADYLVDEHDVIIAAGVNNGAETKVPALLASSHNAIAVGLDTGGSSGGYTTTAGRGRCKPDIVAPRGVTSYSTPVVAAMAARLMEAADRMSGDVPDAGRSEVIKAVLLAGAHKPKDWSPQPGKPLDEHLGAGVVRFDHSYAILTAEPVEYTSGFAGKRGGVPGDEMNGDGWVFRELDLGNMHTVSFALTDPAELSAVLVWHRRIDGRRTTDLVSGKKRWLATPRVADFDLRLERSVGGERVETVAESTSTVDNVEHVYQQVLPAGTYRLNVSRKDRKHEAWAYALAWRTTDPPEGLRSFQAGSGATTKRATAAERTRSQ